MSDVVTAAVSTRASIEIEFADYALIIRNPIPLAALDGIQAMAASYGFDRIDAGCCRPLGATMVITSAKHAPALRQAVLDATPSAAAGDAFEEWLAGPDTGTSSLTIAEVLRPLGRWNPYYDPPVDPSDFGRCRNLLEVMPAWRARLSEVAAVYPRWAPFVGAWAELDALYEHARSSKLYERLKELDKDSREADEAAKDQR